MNTAGSKISFDSDDYRSFAARMLQGADIGQTIDSILDADRMYPLFIAKQLSSAYLSDSVLIAAQSIELVQHQNSMIEDLSSQLKTANQKIDQVLETLSSIIKNGVVVVDPGSEGGQSGNEPGGNDQPSGDVDPSGENPGGDQPGENPENPPVVVEKRILTFIVEGEIVSQIEVERGKLIDTSKVPNASKTGYDFIGWDKFLDDPLMIDEPVADDITFTAVFQPKSIKIVFDAAGGTCPETSAYVEFDDEYGAFYGGSLPVPEYDEHEFLGWQLNGQTILPTTIVKTPYEHTLTAKWKRQENVNPDNPPALPKYTITFINWNREVLKTEQVEEGHNATPPAVEDVPERIGYKAFTGDWSGNYVNVTSDYEVSAVWFPKDDIIASFNANGGAFVDTAGNVVYQVPPLTVTFERPYGEFTEPLSSFPQVSCTGKIFLGWQTSSYGDEFIEPNNTVCDPNNHEISAIWEDNQPLINDDDDDVGDLLGEFDDEYQIDSQDDLAAIARQHMFDFDWLNNL